MIHDLNHYLERPILRAAAEADMNRMWEAKEPSTSHPAIEQVTPEKRVKPLQAYTASSLYGVDLERPPLIIQGLIPAGLSVLAGAPKRGKSWLALSMGIAVSTGMPFLGMETRQGDVLYLDLESRQHRVQDRLQRLMPGAGPERLFITHEAERMDAGLLEQLAEWLIEHPKTSLIIVDTLARVKSGNKRGENAYESDSRIFGELQRFAQSHKIAVLVVHHLKKTGRGDDLDPVERISGSMGLAGTCDSILMLEGKRDDDKSTLNVTARDFEQGEWVLCFDSGAWALQSTDAGAWAEEQDYIRSGAVRGVLTLMRGRQPPVWQGTAAELLEAMQAATDGPLGIYQARQVSEDLERYANKLYNREGVSIRRKIVRGKRILTITQESLDEF